jgi:hypothetical protein
LVTVAVVATGAALAATAPETSMAPVTNETANRRIKRFIPTPSPRSVERQSTVNNVAPQDN